MRPLPAWIAAAVLVLAVNGLPAAGRADTIYQCGFKDGAPVYTINTKPAGAKCRAISGPSAGKSRGAPAGAKCQAMRFRDTIFYRCVKDGVTWVYNRPVAGPRRDGTGDAPGNGTAGAEASATTTPGRMGGRLGPDEALSAIVRTASAEAGIPEALLKAVIEVESGFRPDVVSPAGAQGLMQLMPLTADSLEVEDPFDPEQNVRAGARLLRQLSDRFAGNLENTIAAYYAGASAVRRADGPPDEATVSYVRKVVDRYRKYSQTAPEGAGPGGD